MVPEARRIDFRDLSVGRSAAFTFAVNADEMGAFAAVSGDYNPLHCDDEFARSKGFKGAVVYGGILLAKVSRLIGMELPGRNSVWTTLDMQFSHPLLVGQMATLEGTVTSLSEATSMVELKLTIRSEDRLLARGRAEVVLVG